MIEGPILRMRTELGSSWFRVALLTLILLIAHGDAEAELGVVVDDASGFGTIRTTVRLVGDQVIDAANIAVGFTPLNGSPEGGIEIVAFDAFPDDGVWQENVLRGAAPDLPSDRSILNFAQSGADAGPNGALFELTLDASGASPGDAYEISTNFLGFSGVGLDGQLLTADATFGTAMITIQRVDGDFDSDGQLTVADLDMLSEAVRSQSSDLRFDVNGDGTIASSDRDVWVNSVRGTFFGDANLDGEFNTSDLVLILQAGEYQDDAPMNSTWATGDFNGDGDFNSSDLITAFAAGAYETGPRAAVPVPEPASAAGMVMVAAIALGARGAFGRASGNRLLHKLHRRSEV